MENIRKIVRQTLFEYHNPAVIESNIEDENGNVVGNISGVIHYNVQYLKNWMDKEKIDEVTQKYILEHVKIPVAILKNININDELKNRNYGNEGVQQFLDETYQSDYVLLIADTGENNKFSLEDWYKKFGFKTIGHVGGMPIMLLNRKENFHWLE